MVKEYVVFLLNVLLWVTPGFLFFFFWSSLGDVGFKLMAKFCSEFTLPNRNDHYNLFLFVLFLLLEQSTTLEYYTKNDKLRRWNTRTEDGWLLDDCEVNSPTLGPIPQSQWCMTDLRLTLVQTFQVDWGFCFCPPVIQSKQWTVLEPPFGIRDKTVGVSGQITFHCCPR